jgi:Transglycosylase SLT domain
MTAASAVNEVQRGRVDAAIRSAAARTGVDFNYLYAQARSESGLDPNVRARGSSATGLFQFVDQTWLAMIDKHGAEHGLNWAADAVQRGANGRYYVSEPTLRARVMGLRQNPEAASAMGAAYASDNAAYLQSRVGRPLQSVDLYMAHFLGAGGASKFLRAHGATPNAAAAPAFPEAARANRTIFYKRDGSARSYDEVRNLLGARLNMGGGAVSTRFASIRATPQSAANATPTNDALQQLAALGTDMPENPTSLSPRYARLAYLMLADLGA